MDATITIPLRNTPELRKIAEQLVEFADAIDHQAEHETTKDIGAVPTPPAIAPTVPVPPAAIAPTIPPPPTPELGVVTVTEPIAVVVDRPQDSIIMPISPTATPPAPPAAVELDTEGLPWDERIHSGKKTKYAKDNPQNKTVAGSWKRKRGVQPLTVDQVKAELRLVYPAPTAAVAPVAPLAPVPPAAPATPAAMTPGAVSPDSNLYLPLMKKCTKRIAALQLTLEDMVAICKRHGLDGIAQLAGRPDLIPTIEAEIEELWIRNTQG